MNHAEFEREFDEVMDVMRARAAEGTRVELAEKARPFESEGEIAGEDFGAGFVSVPQPVVAQPVTPPIKPRVPSAVSPPLMLGDERHSPGG